MRPPRPEAEGHSPSVVARLASAKRVGSTGEDTETSKGRSSLRDARLLRSPLPDYRKVLPPLECIAGTHTLQGKKNAYPGWPNQDAHLIMHMGPGKMLVAVFDGHGRNGHLVSHRVRAVIEQQAHSLVARIEASSGASAFSRLFSQLQETLVAESLAYYSGTTATIAFVDANAGIATVAHTGDSTLMVASGRDVEFVSHDHKVEGEDRLRVLARGGEVRETVCGGVVTARVCAPGSNLPGLAMSRALGDQEAHALGVTSKPEICTVPFRPSSVLVVASDGVWDKASQKDVALYIHSGVARDVQEVARGIVVRSRERYKPEGDIDDITAVVVRAKPRRACSPAPHRAEVYSPAAHTRPIAEIYSPATQTRPIMEAPKRLSSSTGVSSYARRQAD